MKEKNIVKYEKEYEIKDHPSINNIQIINGKINFPISLLKQHEFCDYQIYLQCIKSQKIGKITHGNEIQNQLENIFKQESTPTTFENAVKESKKESSMSRDFLLISPDYGIRGNVDEIWMKVDEIVLIKDEQGRTPYESTMNQVRAFSLAFKNITHDKRKIKSALRERGTENLFWIEIFTPEIENEIKNKVNEIHDLLNGKTEFKQTDNKKKCDKCSFKIECEHSLI